MDEEIINIIPKSIYDYPGEEIKPLQEFDKNIFTSEEMDVLITLKTLMAPLTCADISRKSHEEDPYKETDERELISYEHAMELSID